MRICPILDSERLILKPIGLMHVSYEYVEWLNDEDVIEFLEVEKGQSIGDLKRYISGMSDNILFWAIHIKENDKHIGNIKIDPINEKHGYAEYGIMMGDKLQWRKGFATEASRMAIRYCFEVLNLRKINLGVVEANRSAVTLYNKLGFIEEGMYKDHVMYNNKIYNILRMAIFNTNKYT